MPGGQPNRQTRRPRPKAYLACDTCRRRKSRCDGLRPACSHCVDSGAPCNYRSLPTNFESSVENFFLVAFPLRPRAITLRLTSRQRCLCAVPTRKGGGAHRGLGKAGPSAPARGTTPEPTTGACRGSRRRCGVTAARIPPWRQPQDPSILV